MSAEVLREAAALMREKAMRACPDGVWYDQHDLHEALIPLADSVDDPEADATHIASWHPAVALAVAALLDREAADQGERLADLRSAFGEAGDDFMPDCDPLLLAVARAYLGEVTR
jgi:hypothetical protein